MKKEEIIKILEGNKLVLNPEYQFRIDNDQQGIGVGVHRKEKEALFRISLWIDKQNVYTKFVPSINLTIIEEIVQPIFIKHKYRNSYNENTFGTVYLMSIEPETFTQTQPSGLPKTINSEQDVKELFETLNKYITEVAEPFYKKWGDLQFLNNYIKSVPQTDIGDKITDGGYKKAVIFKICNDPNYNEYINWLYNILIDMYEQNKDGDIAYKRNADIITELKEVLGNTEPIV